MTVCTSNPNFEIMHKAWVFLNKQYNFWKSIDFYPKWCLIFEQFQTFFVHLFWPKYRFCENYLNIGPVAWVQTATTYIQKDILKPLFWAQETFKTDIFAENSTSNSAKITILSLYTKYEWKRKKVRAITNFF